MQMRLNELERNEMEIWDPESHRGGKFVSPHCGIGFHSQYFGLAMDTLQKNPVTYLYFIAYVISVLIESHF